jgi:hypothetical protein
VLPSYDVLSRFLLSYGLIDDLDWFELYVYFGAVLWCLPCRAHVKDSRCRVLQYVHDSLIVGCLSDRSINPSRWVVAYGIKGT